MTCNFEDGAILQCLYDVGSFSALKNSISNHTKGHFSLVKRFDGERHAGEQLKRTFISRIAEAQTVWSCY